MLKINVLIIGSGAIGIAIGASLISQDANVSFYSSKKTSQALKENGIERTGLFKHLTVDSKEFRVYEDYNQMPENYFDFIAIAVKTTANTQIAKELHNHKSIMAENARILIFQNGFGYEEEYMKYFKKESIFVTSILTGFKRHDRHVSEITGHTHPLMIGSKYGNIDDVKIITRMLSKSGFPSKTSETIEHDIWAKMLFNCALNPLSAILNVKYGKLGENEHCIEIINELIDETFEVMEKSGHTTNWPTVEEYKNAFFNQFFPDGYEHTSSMLMDINNKNKTEIDTLNGKIVELAEKLNIKVPVSKTITNIIKTMESKF